MKLRVFEAFSGYGSQSIALRNIGVDFEVVAISEINEYAIASYESIHGVVNNLGDISKINVNNIPNHDLFTYSFPCQDISVIGKQKSLEEGSGTRSSLLWECEKIITFKRPKYLLMENVKNLVGKKHKQHFDEWLKRLENLGYTNYWKVLNAKDFNIPQNRERVFVVSILGEHKKFVFPSEMKLENNIESILETNVNKKYYLKKEQTNKLIPYIKNRNSDTKIICEQRCDEGLRFFKDNVCGTIRTINSGGDKRVIETTNSEIRIRKLTPTECFRIMGVSSDDISKIQSKKISDTQQYKLAGNSIVVNVLEELFKNMFLN